MKLTLPIIVFAQFCCTSLWFAGNGVMSNLLETFGLDLLALGHLTSAVQIGFITGTLLFAFLSLADRFPPSKVFFICALFGAIFNLGVILDNNNLGSLLLWRFLTGFSLAGIYPIGMKIAADYYQKDLGKSLGFLVGALVLGTAFPHLLKSFTGAENLPWKMVIIITSLMATLGGFLILLAVPEGPFRKARTGKDLFGFVKVFKNKEFRAAAFGYFGHMWELYAFWAFIPVILGSYKLLYPGSDLNVPLTSFLIIGLGGLACVAGGYLSQKWGAKKVATWALFLSGCCCVFSPLVFLQDSEVLLLCFLIFWGLMVVADSPLFSTLVAENASAESRGTALTIVNSLGFSITILSIQLVTFLLTLVDPFYVLTVLAVGPALGLYSLYVVPGSKIKV
ncbi:MAG: MFS transporter [Gillisia sp.]